MTQESTPPKARRPLRRVPVAHIGDPPALIVERIQRSIVAGRHTVWTDDSGAIYVSNSYQDVKVPLHGIIGIFGIGQSAADIEDDVRERIRERGKRASADAAR